MGLVSWKSIFVLFIHLALKTECQSIVQVTITDWPRLSYWRVTIHCKDRPKLFFDTLCTLADLDYDVYHASASTNDGSAFQDFYIRPRFGDVKFQQKKADHLTYMLEASIQRRFPRGLKVIIVSADTFGLLSKLASVMYDSGIAVTRLVPLVHLNSPI